MLVEVEAKYCKGANNSQSGLNVLPYSILESPWKIFRNFKKITLWSSDVW